MSTFTVTIQRKDQVLTREVNKDSFTVGRSLDCDISLNDSLVSRVHLVVSRRWNQIWIEDKNSSNGTFLNDTKIVQSSPVNVVASDKLRMGRSEYVIMIELTAEVVEPTESMQTPPAEEENPLLADTVMMPPPSDPTFVAEKTLHEAKRKAAQIILEGETQAEKRVQAIYLKAREAQSQAEAFYQTRMSEAHKEADAILNDYQKQGQAHVHEARSMAQELREEVDVYVQSLKQKAKQDVEDMIAEATLKVEKMKAEAFEAAREQSQQESTLLIKNSREEADRILDFARLQSQELQEKVKTDTEALTQLSEELARKQGELMAAIDKLEKTTLQSQELEGKVEAEEQRLRVHLANEESRLKDLYVTEEKRLKELQDSEGKRLTELVAGHEKRIAELVTKEEADLKLLKQQIDDFTAKNKTLETTVHGLMEKQAHLTMDARELESKKAQLAKEYESQKVFLNENLAKEKSQIMKSEEERLEEMRLEMSKRLQKMERDLLDDVIRKKSMMIKEIYSAIEKDIVKVMEPSQWREVAATVESHIQEAIDDRVAGLSQSSVTSEKPTNLLKKRRSEKMRWMSVGLAAGVVAYFVTLKVAETVSNNHSPMQSAVTSEAQKRKDDLEKRRFNPPQTAELKDTYTDAVIYTSNFLEVYADEQFQQKLYKASSQYLLKTWRVDEDKSIKLLSATTALIKELNEKKSKIHPDFVKEGIAKMRELEAETLVRMKEILGTEVRLESYRRFEKNFYREEMQRRQMAQH
ncbi:FHA domain protein [compost metagenome]